MSVFTKAGYRVSSPFGWRLHPITRAKEFHTGIDLVLKPSNAPIKAFTDGEVLYAGFGHKGTGLGGYGNVVLIKDKNNRGQLYAHLSKVLVSKGQKIKKGQVIGNQGSTGQSTGPHLHYEVRKKAEGKVPYGWIADRANNCLNPTEYLENFEPKKSISQMADEVLEGKHGNGHENRRKSLGISKAEYEKVRAEVNRRLSPKKSISEMATEVIQGKHGNGHENRRKSLGIDKATYEKVRAEVNKRM